MLATLTAALFIVSCAHLFLFVANRIMSMDPGPLKMQFKYGWTIVSLLAPVSFVVIFFRWEPVNAALAWRPTAGSSYFFAYCFFALICFFLARLILWTLDRVLPNEARAMVEESISQPPLPAVPSPLPRGLRWCDTTDDLMLVEREIPVSGLAPAFDGLTIAHVTDVHFGQRREMENYLIGVRDLVNGLEADYVVFTGDLASERRHITRSVEYHAGFRGRLGTLAVLGNHDYWTNADRIKAELARTHVRWLGGGERRSIKAAGRRLTIVGTDSPWTHERTDFRRLSRRGTGDAVVVLCHTPDLAPKAARAGASLILSGHTHGGEFNVPLLGPFVVPSAYGLKYARGVYKVGVDSVLSVSGGVGVCSLGARIFCPPEVVLITLRAPMVEAMVGQVTPARVLFTKPNAEAAGEAAIG